MLVVRREVEGWLGGVSVVGMGGQMDDGVPFALGKGRGEAE